MSPRDTGWRRRRKRGHTGACKMIMTKATFAGLSRTEACEGIARRMLKSLEDSKVAKVNIRELVEQVKDQYCARCEASKK